MGSPGPLSRRGSRGRMRHASFAFLFSLLSAGACTPYDPTLPAQPFLCGQSDPKCPDGFTCSGMDAMNHPVCVGGDGSGPVVDSGHTSGFDCAEQSTSTIEGPNGNNDISHAWQTPINDAGKTTF